MPSAPEIRRVEFFASFSWISHGFRQLLAHPARWILATIAFLAGAALLQLIPYAGPILSNLLFPILGAGFLLASLRQARGEPVAWRDFLFGFRERFAPLALLSLVSWLLILASLAFSFLAALLAAAWVGQGISGPDPSAAAGLLILLLAMSIASLLIFPALMALWFSIPLVAFSGLTLRGALKASFRAFFRNAMPLCLHSLAASLLLLAALLPFGAGLILAIPVLAASFAKSYSDIFAEPASPPAA